MPELDPIDFPTETGALVNPELWQSGQIVVIGDLRVGLEFTLDDTEGSSAATSEVDACLVERSGIFRGLNTTAVLTAQNQVIAYGFDAARRLYTSAAQQLGHVVVYVAHHAGLTEIGGSPREQLHATNVGLDERLYWTPASLTLTSANLVSDILAATLTNWRIPTTAPVTPPILNSTSNAVAYLEATKLLCWFGLSKAQGSLRRDVVESVRRQLANLLSADEWETADSLPSVHSFEHLVTFLSRNNELKAPLLAITRGGNFVASFLKGRQNIVRLEFDPKGWTKWLVYLAPVGGDDLSRKGTGLVPSDGIRAQLASYDVWTWMTK